MSPRRVATLCTVCTAGISTGVQTGDSLAACATRQQILESKRAAPRISLLKAMNTIPIRPLLTLKLVTLASLTLLLLLRSGQI